ncbi:aromatic ring-hydroxylating oxygenase subunit alpha [Streptomyces pseudovenezuelae]|uniref:Phenylpropionate dioxygenase-like ring-hydroxylating dioxygenase large terminal subunit n=1 Tax=Streptomyces pseudovenezuelae TaxID=67350 RepID=A0ABT6LA39_9ACTN|nr:aromatic ring-hydroxylating dioxygenase subunit alpha [Streptomyces pseudovenezuelae]MDH6213183.1 phenylpropionate dioxygenase-like ring-hydroxylating dioxygenase large terminal subunit [Streptomyces pseudovenezuelae]
MDTEEIVAELERYLGPDAAELSLPPAAFTSPELWEIERERVFGRSWILVAHADELAETGSYVALSVAGEPVVVVRDEGGTLRGLSPVCRHRLMPVVEEGAGRTDVFTCPYHLWRYGLDGQLIGATHMKRNPAFDPSACRLPRFAVEEWRGFVFVNLDTSVEPLGPHLRRIDENLTNYRLSELTQVAGWTEEWHCNWKIAVENAHENYHVMGLHPETLQPTTPGGAETRVRADSPWADSMRVRYATPLEPVVLDLTEEERSHLYGFFVFPSGSLAASGDMVIWLSLIPSAIDRTLVRGGVLMPAAMIEGQDREAVRKEAEAYAALINGEDQRGLEEVQRGAVSRFAERGHLSPKEPGVLLFYRGLARALLREDAEWPGEL